MTRRSAGRRVVARALWYAGPQSIEIKPQTLAPLQPDQARVRTRYSGLNCGIERLVIAGGLAPADQARLRPPELEGRFPFPVRYGSAAVGVVDEGPDELVGRMVFSRYPHQDVFQLPAAMLVMVPDGVTAQRATLATAMETALNALWDGGAAPGDTVVIVGAEPVGLLSAALAAQLPGATAIVADENGIRRAAAEGLGARFASLSEVADVEADLVIHASGTAVGLNAAIGACGFEATLVETGPCPDRPAAVELSGAFMSRRLRLVASDPAHVALSRRSRWSARRRLEAALALLTNPAFDGLVANEITFDSLPSVLPDRLAVSYRDLPPIIRYET